MKVNLDIFEMYYLLESCFRGSHLRSETIIRFVDEWYHLLTPRNRQDLYTWILRDIYNGDFKPRSQLCGADKIFMTRYNPDNQYKVTAKYNDKTDTIEAFLMDGRYYTSSHRFIAEEYIQKIEKL